MPSNDKKRSQRASKKAGYLRYKQKSTCVSCQIYFKSPKQRKRHVDSGHQWKPEKK